MALVIGMAFSCNDKKKEEEQFIRPVKYHEVGYLGGEKIRTFSGTAQTDIIINLGFRNTGIITVLDMRLGQKVEKGQLLAKLDNVQSRLSYEQALTQQNSAASQMNTAKLSLNRVRSLFEKGSSSLSDFEAAKNAHRTAQEGYESAKRGVAIQQEQIRFGYLYAPMDGVIAAINSELDENVGPGQTVATLNAGTDMEIALGIPESVINGINEGMQVNVVFPSLSNREFKATVTEVSPALDANTATYPVRLTMINPSDEIKSGMAANVIFDFGEKKKMGSTLVVPSNSVGEDSNGKFVFLIEGDQNNAVVKKQSISIGNLSTEGFEILEGLAVGQRVATAGLQTLLDGQNVKID